MYVHPLNILPRARRSVHEEKASSDRGLSEAKVLFVRWSCYRFLSAGGQIRLYSGLSVKYVDLFGFPLIQFEFGLQQPKSRNRGCSCRHQRLSTMLLWVVVRKIINYLKVEPVINCQLSHPETHSQNKSVCQV